MEEVREYSFTNGKYSFSLLNLGCAVTSICVPDRNGKVENIVLHFSKDNVPMILGGNGYLGLTVGRFANRIGKASFSLDGVDYGFAPNDHGNFLHSGPDGIWSRIWRVHKENDGFTCLLSVKDMEDGFPGDLDLKVRFSLSEDGVFRIHYDAVCSRNCPLNLTNHTYFNLTGDPSQSIEDHVARFWTPYVLETDDELIPTGRLIATKGTAWDFSEPKKIGRDISDPALSAAGGYDHALVIERPEGQNRGFTRYANIRDEKTGRIMECFTDLPAVHFYSGNFITEKENGYSFRHGFCLETEFYPDSVNRPEFPSCICRAGEHFESSSVYHFYTDNQVADRNAAAGTEKR